MDIKSMSKSKRSHTQHHQPKKPQNPKTLSSSISSTKKDGKEKKKGTQPSPPTLPSNWDRYEIEEDDDNIHEIPIYSDSDNMSHFAASKPERGVDVDMVKPKSKGADFRDLIAQAKESRSYYSPSFDDKLPEFNQGVAPMLAARGEKIILQDRDDDFLVEDVASGTQEAPFLTLNLEDLAERLSKIDVARRLFIESDLFPPEVCGQDANETDNQASFQTPERGIMGRVDSFGELLSLYLEEERMAKTQDDTDKHCMMSSSNVSICRETKADTDVIESKLSDLEGVLGARETEHVNHGDRKATYSKLDDAGQDVEVAKQVTKSKVEDLEFLRDRKMIPVSHVTEQDTTPSTRFEADAADAELDLLLGSFTEAKLSDTPMNEPETSVTRGALLQGSLGQSAPAFPVTTSLDDELDDLLALTANLSDKDGDSISHSSSHIPSSSSQPSSKSKVLEDLDSWLNKL
ncbi:Protein rlx [Bienertia sinuspersici]